MPATYSSRIKEYCAAREIEIPVGFHRHPASRYAAIIASATPPKLVAKTWFDQADVVYYLRNVPEGERVRILDFHDRHELQLAPDGKLIRGDAF